MFSKQVVTDPGCEQWVHTSYCSPTKVREMVTHLGTHLFKRIIPMYAPCVGHHNRLCFKCSNCHKLLIKQTLSY